MPVSAVDLLDARSHEAGELEQRHAGRDRASSDRDLTMLARLSLVLARARDVGLAAAQRGKTAHIEDRSDRQEIALLTILIACGEKAIEAFQASDNPVDVDFLTELERVIQRSRKELAALKQSVPDPS